MSDFDYDWLNELKTGDKVIVKTGYYGSDLKKVEKITPTQIVVGGSRFRKKDGYLMGANDIWCTTKLHPATEYEVNKIIYKKLRSKIKQRNFDSVSDEKIKQIAEILKISLDEA